MFYGEALLLEFIWLTLALAKVLSLITYSAFYSLSLVFYFRIVSFLFNYSCIYFCTSPLLDYLRAIALASSCFMCSILSNERPNLIGEFIYILLVFLPGNARKSLAPLTDSISFFISFILRVPLAFIIAKLELLSSFSTWYSAVLNSSFT